MPPRRRAATPPPIDVEAVRHKLSEGKIVRVGITRSAQFPEGATGRVRSVGNPETDGDEYVQVELSLNGTKDILPFTPTDLTPATRGRPPGSGRKPAVGAAGSVTESSAGEPVSRMLPSAERVSTEPAARPPVTPEHPPPASTAPRAAAAGPRPPTENAGSPPPGRVSQPDLPTGAKSEGANDSKGRAARGPRRPAAVSITVATTPAEPTQWRIEARIGTKVAVKSAAASPARVWQLVQTLDNDALSRAVGAILEEQRSAAQARADALAAELAAVQAELRALPEAGG